MHYWDTAADLIRHINDPEHPLTLEALRVVQLDHIGVDAEGHHVSVQFTPTIPHCSMATLIGLCIRVRLLRALPARFKVDVRVREGTHQSEHAGASIGLGPCFDVCRFVTVYQRDLPRLTGSPCPSAVNKQLSDKERVAAALENTHLLEVVNSCLKGAVDRF